MKLPTAKRILREDVKGIADQIGPVIDTLNSFMETVYQAMNRNMTFHENIRCQVKEIPYRTPSTYPAGVEKTKFLSELKVKATGLWPVFAVDKSDYSPAAGPVYIPWVEDDGEIVISTITGLEASKIYTIRLIVF